jgi:hypothetical protein
MVSNFPTFAKRMIISVCPSGTRVFSRKSKSLTSVISLGLFSLTLLCLSPLLSYSPFSITFFYFLFIFSFSSWNLSFGKNFDESNPLGDAAIVRASFTGCPGQTMVAIQASAKLYLRAIARDVVDDRASLSIDRQREKRTNKLDIANGCLKWTVIYLCILVVRSIKIMILANKIKETDFRWNLVC